jgi:hypothetical protein
MQPLCCIHHTCGPLGVKAWGSHMHALEARMCRLRLGVLPRACRLALQISWVSRTEVAQYKTRIWGARAARRGAAAPSCFPSLPSQAGTARSQARLPRRLTWKQGASPGATPHLEVCALKALHKVAPGAAGGQRAGAVVRAGRQHVRAPLRLLRLVTGAAAAAAIGAVLGRGGRPQNLGAGGVDVSKAGRRARLY